MKLNKLFVSIILSFFLIISTTLLAASEKSQAGGVPDIEERVVELESALADALVTISELQAQIDVIKVKTACVSDSSTDTEFMFEGCNVHIRNGAGSTNSLNTFGNLIIGYNEKQADEAREGSHNLIIGQWHA